jgi:PQQ-dependent catabolism-associated CXXCW motif protein
MIRFLALIGFGITLMGVAVAQNATPEEPEAFRLDNYRAPTPAGLHGARTISTPEAAALWRSGDAVFIDVVARPPRPDNLPAGTIWHEKPRRNIPGSIWLPNTGYGELNPATDHYFEATLDRASQKSRSKLLVFYCLKDCWMSWNAAKRALAANYKNVVWYPEGTDGWSSAGLPLEEAQPLAIEED